MAWFNLSLNLTNFLLFVYCLDIYFWKTFLIFSKNEKRQLEQVFRNV